MSDPSPGASGDETARIAAGTMEPMRTPVRSWANWLFRDRSTGGIVIAQWPNAPLTLWLVTVAARWVFHPRGDWSTIVQVVGIVALVIWATDEIARGVNPWRRMLGAGVLLTLLIGWALGR